jgi:hypothetical protein
VLVTGCGVGDLLADFPCRKRQHLAAVRLRLDHILIKQTVRDATETDRNPT